MMTKEECEKIATAIDISEKLYSLGFMVDSDINAQSFSIYHGKQCQGGIGLEADESKGNKGWTGYELESLEELEGFLKGLCVAMQKSW